MIRNIKYSYEQKKILRVIGMMKYLQKERRTINELALEFGANRRTIYRYLNLMDSLDIDIDQDFDGKYFIVDNACPICGKEHKHRSEHSINARRASKVHSLSPVFLQN
jgi:hypothetical protein